MTGRSFPSGFAKYWGFERTPSCFFIIRFRHAFWLLAGRLAKTVSALVHRHPPAHSRRRKPAFFRRSELDFYALFRRLFFR